MKQCGICGNHKPYKDYHKSSTSKDGCQHRCKECSKTIRKEYHLKNKEKYNLKNKLWVEQNREAIRNYQLAKYGITQVDYEYLREQQKECCAICGRHETLIKRCNYKGAVQHALHVDHCHTTGKVRGLLCFNCNALLGKCRDSISILNNAIRYLESAKEKKK